MAKFTHGYRHNTDTDMNREKDTNEQGGTQMDRNRDTTDKDGDTSGQGHRRTGTGTQMDRDWDTDG